MKVPKGFTEDERTWIRERLLSEGERLFSSHGLQKTTVAELAQAARISTGAFYQFYGSKEALFMDVVEVAEERGRQEMFAAIDRPGPSPRARLYAVLSTGFDLLYTMPILQFFTGGDYDLLFRRIPPEKLEEHMASDRIFLEQLIARCCEAGIPIQLEAEEIASMMYPLVLAAMHGDDFGRNGFGHGIGPHLELVAAYCLGEVELQLQTPGTAHARLEQRSSV